MVERLPPLRGRLIGSPAGFHVTPHWLLQPGFFGNVKRQVGHRDRPVLPRRKWTPLCHPRRGPENNAERRRVSSGLRAALPESRTASLFAPSGGGILDPYHLKHRVPKEETAASRALSRMLVRRSLCQTKL